MIKNCNKCNSDKSIEDFYKGRNECKVCFNEKSKENYHKTKNTYKKIEYRKNTRDERLEYLKEYKLKNKEKLVDYSKNYSIENKDKINEYSKNYFNKNKDILYVNQKEYRLKNKDIINEKRNGYRLNKKINDPIYKLSCSIRSLISSSLKKNNYKKNSKTQDILGCSFIEFKTHIESKFERWMNYENYGRYNGDFNYGWDIDHIIPLSSAKTEEEIIKLNHYTNLQPLCSKINRFIKRDIY